MNGPGRQDVISGLPVEDQPETGPAKALPPQFRRTVIDYRTKEPAGTIIIDTPNTYLYLVMGNGKAMRYGNRGRPRGLHLDRNRAHLAHGGMARLESSA